MATPKFAGVAVLEGIASLSLSASELLPSRLYNRDDIIE